MLYFKNLTPETHKSEMEKKFSYNYHDDFDKIEGLYLGKGENILPIRSKTKILETLGFLGLDHNNSMKAIEEYFDFLKAINPDEYIIVAD